MAKILASSEARNSWLCHAVVLVGVGAVLLLAGLGMAARSAQAASIGADAPAKAASRLLADNPDTATPSVVPLAGIVKALSKGAYLGVYRPAAPWTPTAVDDYSSIAGKPAAIVMWFQPWAAGRTQFDTDAAVSVWKRGAIPMISWEPWAPGQTPHNLAKPADMPNWRLSKITSGKYDAYITQFARDVKSAGGPVMISPFHEMNGSWYPWCGTVNGNKPRDFIAAWRHVHDIFKHVGATNVTWVWSINFDTYPNVSGNQWSAYYPGSSYVDWVGVSGFNWGRAASFGKWKTFEQIYRAPLKYLKTTHRPVIITEIASVSKGGDKPSWLLNAFSRMRSNHSEIKAVIYYDAKESAFGQTQDWRVNSSKSSQNAYRRAVSPSYFSGGAAAALSAWRAKLMAGGWSTLLSAGPSDGT